MATACRQGFVALFEMNEAGIVVGPGDVTDRMQVHHHRAMHLDKLRRIQLQQQFLQRCIDQCLAGESVIASPGDAGVFFLSARR